MVPAIRCESSSGPLVLNNPTISQPLECEVRKSLHRIKLHTSTTFKSGTDADISLNLKVKKKDIDEPFEECLFEVKNHGNDRERGQTDIYFAKDLGKY